MGYNLSKSKVQHRYYERNKKRILARQKKYKERLKQ